MRKISKYKEKKKDYKENIENEELKKRPREGEKKQTKKNRFIGLVYFANRIN